MNSAEATKILPPGCVTGIGSLPFKSGEAAVRFVAQHSPLIPFWPQLPQRSKSEQAIVQALGELARMVFPRSKGYGFEVREDRSSEFFEALRYGSAALDWNSAQGFFAFAAALEDGIFLHARAVKGQLEGPITLGFYLFRAGMPFAFDRELLDAVASYVIRLAHWQVERLQAAGLPVILFIDEPALCLSTLDRLPWPRIETARILGRVITAIRSTGAIVGLHCCNDLPFCMLPQLCPDILSFDAHSNVDAFFSAIEAKAFVQRGGTVALGLVPTMVSLDGMTGQDLLLRLALATHSNQTQLEDVLAHSLITASCGLGMLSEAAARSSFLLATQLSSLVEAAIAA